MTTDRPEVGEAELQADLELVTVRRAQLEAAESIFGFVADGKPIGPTGRNLARDVRAKFAAALATADKATREPAWLDWRSAIGPIDQREEAAGIIEELLGWYVPAQARDHAADLVRRLREPAPDDALRTALDELRRLSEAATPGPWWGDGPPGGFGTVFVDAPTHDERVWLFDAREASAADGAFVAAAVNYVRRALSPAAPEPPEAGR